MGPRLLSAVVCVCEGRTLYSAARYTANNPGCSSSFSSPFRIEDMDLFSFSFCLILPSSSSFSFFLTGVSRQCAGRGGRVRIKSGREGGEPGVVTSFIGIDYLDVIDRDDVGIRLINPCLVVVSLTNYFFLSFLM